MEQSNIDNKTVIGFGEEWSKFDQKQLNGTEFDQVFDDYFNIFDWSVLPKDPIGFDMGSGSGRWAKEVAKKVSLLYCIDASEDALNIAKVNLKDAKNIQFLHASVSNTGLESASMDFGYSLGVLHHVPDTQRALNDCVVLLKEGAPFLIYLYYNLDNKPLPYKFIWKISDLLRKVISALPFGIRSIISDILAATLYFPLARTSFILNKLNISSKFIPLHYYKDKSFYTMRTDSLDRFGTKLEQRFSKKQIEMMLIDAGLEKIHFSNKEPYWTAIGYKKSNAV